MLMDKNVQTNIDDLLDSINILDEKRENLQLEINRSLSELAVEDERSKKELLNLNEQKMDQVESVKSAQNKKNEIDKQIGYCVAELAKVKEQEDQLSVKLRNIKQRKLSMSKAKEQDESVLSHINNDIKDVLKRENELANKIKEALSLDDIIATTTKYQASIDNLKQEKQELENKFSVQNKKIENQKLEISKTEKSITGYEEELNDNDTQSKEIEEKIEQYTQKNNNVITDINQKKSSVGITINSETSLKNKMISSDKERKQLFAAQNKFLKYPKFSVLSEKAKGRKLLLIGSPVSLFGQSLFSTAYFCRVQKPDFSKEISPKELSPFLISGFSDNREVLNGVIDKYKKDVSFKEVDKLVWECREDNGNLHALFKRRGDHSVWQILYFGSGINNEQKVVKVDAYDMLGNIRYTQYPSYDNDSVVGVQEQWFTPKGAVFLISQSFGDSEQFQILNLDNQSENSSIDKIMTGIDNLFSYWIESVGQDYLVLSDSKALRLIDRLNIQNIVLYIESYDSEEKKQLAENQTRFDAILCSSLSLAQVVYWKNKNTNIWISK